MSEIMSYSLEPQVYAEGNWVDAPPSPPDRVRTVRVLTWNVWFGELMFEERRAALVAELERRQPDVIALQEVTEELIDYLLDLPWVHASYQISELEIYDYDVLILSRIPIRQAFEVMLPTQMGRRLLAVELTCGLTVATTHLESTKDESETRASQLEIIQPALLENGGDFVLVGDMNFAPGDTLEEQTLDPSLVDVWAALRPGENGYTIDTDINSMRLEVKRRQSQKRIDRVFARCERWRPVSIEMIGTLPIRSDGIFVSDHFGLEAVFAAK